MLMSSVWIHFTRLNILCHWAFSLSSSVVSDSDDHFTSDVEEGVSLPYADKSPNLPRQAGDASSPEAPKRSRFQIDSSPNSVNGDIDKSGSFVGDSGASPVTDNSDAAPVTDNSDATPVTDNSDAAPVTDNSDASSCAVIVVAKRKEGESTKIIDAFCAVNNDDACKSVL